MKFPNKNDEQGMNFRERDYALNEDLTNATSQLDTIATGPNGKPLVYIDCILRPTSGVWALIEDSVHQANGVASITQDSENIIVTFDETVGKILSFSISVDEEYQSLNLTAGASVGTSQALIKISKQVQAHSAYIYYDGASWLVVGSEDIIVDSFVGGALTLSHPTVDTSYGVVTQRREDNHEPRAGGMGSTTSVVKFYDNDVLVTTPTTQCKVYFSRIYPTRANLNPSNQIDISQFGNLWVHGTFEKA